MAMGGFSGSDNALTLDRFRALVASGELRFVSTASGGGPGGQAGSSEVTSWVASACTPVTVDGATTSVFDCAAAVTG